MGGTRDSGAGACPLVGGVGNQCLWLEGPGGPGSSSCALVCVEPGLGTSGGWRPRPGAAVGLRGS